MKLGMVGLGRMGSGITRRLEARGIAVESYDPNVASSARSLRDLVRRLEAPRVVWMMIPAGEVTETTFGRLLGLLEPGDTIVDGGNAHYRDSQRRAREARGRRLSFVDVGVSGGVWGFDEGFCLMAGGTATAIRRLRPVFDALAPEGGFAHVGPAGAGHFVKMVHNGIEYGLMQAYAEGFELLHASELPLDLTQVADVWRHGSVVRSWLLDLLHRAFEQEGGDLERIAGYVEDSGEGRWTVQAAIDEGVPAPVITAALYARFASRQDESFAARVNAALRNQFGGHAVRRE